MTRLLPLQNESALPDHGRCLDSAFRFLSFRPRSESEIKSFLAKKGYETNTIEKVLIRLRADNLVDDEAFAQFWKSNRQTFSPRGHSSLRRELRNKGIEPDMIDRILEDLDEHAAACKAAEKKAKHLAGHDYQTFRRKLAGFLGRRGFAYDICNSVVNSFWEKRGKDDEE